MASVIPAAEANASATTDDSSIAVIFVAALRRLVVGWSLLLALSLLVTALVDPALLVTAASIGVASGAISVLALAPGIWLGGRGGLVAARPDSLIAAIVAAMAIRITGTVALLVLCRYQMGLPLTTIAAMVCGWYLLLTSLEVALLARGILWLAAGKTCTTGTESKLG